MVAQPATADGDGVQAPLPHSLALTYADVFERIDEFGEWSAAIDCIADNLARTADSAEGSA